MSARIDRMEILFLQRSHPSALRAKEALDAVLVAAVFEQRVAVLFRDEGVMQLLSPDDDSGIRREVAELVSSLPDYGVDALFACRDSLARHGVDSAKLLVSVTPVGADAQARLLSGQHAVISD